MFKATKPFNDKLTTHPEEPSLRIGRTVPKGAVNLAYYYNPTATDAEKVLTADAPRQTIDHRVEEAYRYLFNQASNDDNLFPGFVWYEDEEGYQGRLGRMYVNWYPEAHIETKHFQETKISITAKRQDVEKMIEYPLDVYGYSGNLYLDAARYEVLDWEDDTEEIQVSRQVYNHELNYHKIFQNNPSNNYVSSQELNTWLVEPGTGGSPWPSHIQVNIDGMQCTSGNSKVANYVKNYGNPYDEAVGTLTFDHIEYEPVFKSSSSGTTPPSKEVITAKFISSNFKYEGSFADPEHPTQEELDAAQQYVIDCSVEVRNTVFKEQYAAEYNTATDLYEYDKTNGIQDFMTLATSYCDNTGAMGFQAIRQAMSNNKDIVIVLDNLSTVFDNENDINSDFHFEAQYFYKVADRGYIGQTMYNVIAVYTAIDSQALIKTITQVRQVPRLYKCYADYTGILRKVWYDYDGVAYYRGAITKGGSIGNVNPEDDNEILMFSDSEGYLRRPVYHTNENGEVILKNYYRVEADSVYVTDVFKDGVPCFYKYNLKQPIYDYRGSEQNGLYEGDAVKLYTSALKNIPSSYKYNIKLQASKTELIDYITASGYTRTKEVPVQYDATLYTSFISSSSDTFKVTYNSYNNDDDDNIALNSGVIEEVYNYPAMIEGIDYNLETVDSRQRISRVHLNKPYRLRDSRHYVTFTFKVVAERKGTYVKNYDGSNNLVTAPTIIESDPITVSILNKDFALPIEEEKFIGRGFIISPNKDGIYLSPMDLILQKQAADRIESVITYDDTDYVFSCKIIDIADVNKGAVNIICNPSGAGIITAETTVDTGFIDGRDLWELPADFNEKLLYSNGYTFTKKLTFDNPYFIEDGWIYPGMKVKCLDSRRIKVAAPREEGLLDSWYPRIQFGHYSQVMDQYGSHTKVCYSMPEYDSQHFSAIYGKPYVDIVQEKVEILNSHMVKVSCYPIFINNSIDNTNIHIYKKLDDELTELSIKDISFSDGVIILQDTISENDNIVCDYTYYEEFYVYRGFWRNPSDFGRIDLNPNIYHTYNDLTYTPSEIKPTKNLFNKVIYFFMRPTLVYEVNESHDDLIYDAETINVTSDMNDDTMGTILSATDNTLYHQIDNPVPESNQDIYIGSVFIRQNSSLHSTILIDSRTRGGGVLASMSDSLRHELEPESDFYLDIGYYDGEPYQENGVIIVRLSKEILKDFGGRFTPAEVEQKVKRWLGLGVYPIIEYVDVYSKRDMPQYTLRVQESYTNVINITPEIYIDSVPVIDPPIIPDTPSDPDVDDTPDIPVVPTVPFAAYKPIITAKPYPTSSAFKGYKPSMKATPYS